MGFVSLMNFLCAHSSFWNSYQKQKAMGFVNLQTSFAPLLLLTRDEIKKAQRHRYYVGISMNESIIANVATKQRRKYYANILMNESTMTNVTTTQRRRCCSFDSPGLARNEPTLGKHSQGDSTP